MELAELMNSPKSIHDAYTEWSSTYDQDRNLTRDLDAFVSQTLLADLRVDTAIEIGCGTGKNTLLLAGIAKEVIALDFTEAMIAKAENKVRELGTTNVSFKVADVTKHWPCDDQCAQLVVCNLVLEHIADLDFVFCEASRCLTDGGRFFISELHPFRQYQGTKAQFQRDRGREEIEAFVHHMSDFFSAAQQSKFAVIRFDEWWHEENRHKPPRLVSFIFAKT
jgi:ubiquinone/menaquinone biosynthesis C-methylase UbiE